MRDNARNKVTGRIKPKLAGRPTAREAALSVLSAVDREQAFSNLQLNQTLRKASMERQEAALATELVYGTIQRLNTLDYFLNRFVRKQLDRMEVWVRNLLRMSLYQILYLNGIPEHAAVHEAVEIAKNNGHAGISGLVNGVLRNCVRQKETLTIDSSLPPVPRIALEYSHPEWLVARWTKEYGQDRTTGICASNNQPPHTSIRVNSLKTSREALIEVMRKENIDIRPSPVSGDGLIASGAGNMAATPWYRSGEISVQDESSMLVAEVLGAGPGMKVLDACAAPGGKTAHIAERMQDEGEVWACDIHEHKVKLIAEQRDRLGLSAIRPFLGDALKLAEKFPRESFDRILLDAPCSGLGIIRRKPDLKWSKNVRDIAGLPDLQYRMLEAAAPLLKPGGVLVYSTCTIWPEENEGTVRKFLERHPEFHPSPLPHSVSERLSRILQGTPAGMLRILPDDYHCDGFFIFRMAR